MAKWAFRKVWTIFFPFSKIYSAVCPTDESQKLLKDKADRFHLFLQTSWVLVFYLLGLCLWRALNLRFSFSICTWNHWGNYKIPLSPMMLYTAYTVLSLSHSQWEHCLPDISLIMGNQGFWCLATLYHQCWWWLQEIDWEAKSLCVVYKVTSKLHSWRKGYKRAEGDLPGFWCLHLAATFRGSTG